MPDYFECMTCGCSLGRDYGMPINCDACDALEKHYAREEREGVVKLTREEALLAARALSIFDNQLTERADNYARLAQLCAHDERYAQQMRVRATNNLTEHEQATALLAKLLQH